MSRSSLFISPAPVQASAATHTGTPNTTTLLCCRIFRGGLFRFGCVSPPCPTVNPFPFFAFPSRNREPPAGRGGGAQQAQEQDFVPESLAIRESGRCGFAVPDGVPVLMQFARPAGSKNGCSSGLGGLDWLGHGDGGGLRFEREPRPMLQRRRRRKRKKHGGALCGMIPFLGPENGSSRDPAPCSMPSHGRRDLLCNGLTSRVSATERRRLVPLRPFPKAQAQAKPNIVSQAAPSRRDQLSNEQVLSHWLALPTCIGQRSQQ